MKITYIQPTLNVSSYKSKIMYFLRGRKLNVNQEGFFVQSLAPTKIVSIDNVRDLTFGIGECLVANSKATKTGTEINLYEQFKVIKRYNCKKAIFLSNDVSSFMPEDKVLDLFDIVFKREAYKDLDRYHISIKNKEKIRTTMLPCPLVKPKQLKFLKLSDKGEKTFDVFFNGQATHRDRILICEALKKDTSVVFVGGLQPRRNLAVPPEIHFEKLNARMYKKHIQQSKINLAIEGIGDFTYRHLELLSQGAFMMCSSKIKDLDLPIELNDGEHYVSYEDVNDLVVKIRKYLNRPEERQQIARNGFERFKRDYSVTKHGDFIKNAILNV